MKKRTINILRAKKTGKHQSLEAAVGKCSKEIKKGEFLKRTGRKAKKTEQTKEWKASLVCSIARR